MSPTKPPTPTFSTRNQSRRKVYTLLCATLFLLLLVTVVVLFKKHKHEQMFKGYSDSGARQGGSRYKPSQTSVRRQPASVLSDSATRHEEQRVPKGAVPYYKGLAVRPTATINIPRFGGPIRGHVRRMADGKAVSSFLAVPYARPPTDELRFEAPVRSTKWSATKEAVYQPAKCPQVRPRGIVSGLAWLK